ncbi:unnamed protein product [Lymnaea stagnalis]|uniref:Uncharacterized protein n=1 Tax=Lymnaea stagnalis TaxID=6523 RepID=A0AAV2HG46_LYMST
MEIGLHRMSASHMLLVLASLMLFSNGRAFPSSLEDSFQPSHKLSVDLDEILPLLSKDAQRAAEVPLRELVLRELLDDTQHVVERRDKGRSKYLLGGALGR